MTKIMQTTDFTFTQSQLLNCLDNWKLEPFTPNEYRFISNYIKQYESFDYGQDDMESLILEILSDATDDQTDFIINPIENL